MKEKKIVMQRHNLILYYANDNKKNDNLEKNHTKEKIIIQNTSKGNLSKKFTQIIKHQYFQAIFHLIHKSIQSAHRNMSHRLLLELHFFELEL